MKHLTNQSGQMKTGSKSMPLLLYTFLMVFLLGMSQTGKAQNCQASLQVNKSINLKVVATDSFNLNQGNGGTHYWEFGDSTVVTQAHRANYTFQSPGIYQVCNEYRNNNCSDTTICDSVKVGACKADFSYSKNNLTVNFNEQASVNPSNDPNAPYYSWRFKQNGSFTSNKANPSHTYQYPGNYQVTLRVYDSSAFNCYDTHTETIQVGSINCSAGFSYNVNASTKTVNFNDQSTTFDSTKIIKWQFGDGNTSNQPNPSHQYNTADTFNVCQTVYDSIKQCVDSVCKDVVIPDLSKCNAQFTANKGSGNYTYNFNNHSSGINLTYNWDFDDGNTTTTKNPTHTFPSGPDTFSVELVASNSQCSDTATKTIMFTYQNTLSGMINVNNQNLDTGEVALYYYDSCYSGYIKTDSTPFNQYDSVYKFYNLKAGKHLVRAKPSSNSSYSSSHMMTYHQSTADWTKADSIVFSGLFGSKTADISLVSKGSSSGSSSIGGNVSGNKGSCTNKRQPTNKPLSNEAVILMDNDMNKLEVTYTDQNGDYTFDNVGTGQYFVKVELPGFEAEMADVSIGDANSQKSGVDFEASDNQIAVDQSSGINSGKGEFKISTFPNPADKEVQIKLETQQDHDFNLQVMDITGQTLIEENHQAQKGMNKYQLNSSGLEAGIYILHLQMEEGSTINERITVK